MEIVELLVREGADVNAPPCDTLSHFIPHGSKMGFDELFTFSGPMNHYPDIETERRTALQAAAGGGHIENVKLLIRAKAQVNAPLKSDASGRTALQAAAENGHSDIVELLIQDGSYVDALPSKEYGFSALQAAAMNGHLEIVKQLIEQMADVNGPPADLGGGTGSTEWPYRRCENPHRKQGIDEFGYKPARGP